MLTVMPLNRPNWTHTTILLDSKPALGFNFDSEGRRTQSSQGSRSIETCGNLVWVCSSFLISDLYRNYILVLVLVYVWILFSVFHLQNAHPSIFLLFSHCSERGVWAALIHSPLRFAWVHFINPLLPASWPSRPSPLACFAVSWVFLFASLLFSKAKLNTAVSVEARGKTVRPW